MVSQNLNSEPMHYGLDIGGTKIELAIFDSQLERVESWRMPTPQNDYQALLSAIAQMVVEADQKCNKKGTVGIGFPGYLDNQGRSVSANIGSVNGQLIVTDTCAKLGRVVAFENDVKAFALSEARGGAAHSKDNALGVVLGTGLAGGLCVAGQLYKSKQNVSCEFGHVSLPAVLQQRYQFPLRQCGCGLVGCVETYLAGPGLLWMCSHFNTKYTSVPMLVEACRNNEAPAIEVMDVYIDCLGCYFAQLTLMYDPDIIVLGGGVSNIAEIYARLPNVMQKYFFNGVIAPPVVAAMYGDSSGVRGAAILGRDNANSAVEQN
ncbi:ROK family protein [Paraglaciecola arctica]|uniref:ROK family protein n=1 Tax=Paraglaciecola arctica TaxID=1128911 RepID=UPI001C069042|nr:ROK family protein [Paraglaciecola arctica]